mgnify:CR=1 FL=1
MLPNQFQVGFGLLVKPYLLAFHYTPSVHRCQRLLYHTCQACFLPCSIASTAARIAVIRRRAYSRIVVSMSW